MDIYERVTDAASIKPEVQQAADEIVADMDMLEALAAIKDGGLFHEDVAPELILRLITELGPEELADHLGPEHPLVGQARAATSSSPRSTSPQHSTPPPPTRIPVRRFAFPQHFAIAASLALVASSVSFLLLNSRGKNPSDFGWSGSSIAAAGPLEPLPIDRLRPSTVEPDWNAPSGVVTMGPGDASKRQALQRATVILRDADGMGSGVLISADGWILTNYHVVASAVQRASLLGEPARLDTILAVVTEGRVRPASERPKATVYRVDPAHDLALLKLAEAPAPLAPISFVAVADQLPAEGDEVTAIGSPGGLAPWNMRTGSIARIYQHPAELSENVGLPARPPGLIQRVRAEVIQTDIGISPGDSGGPLLDQSGRLVGVTFATPANLRAGSAGLHVALPHVRALIESLPSKPELVPPDFFAAADPALVPASPRPSAVNGYLESVVWPFVSKSDDQSSASEVAAVVTYIDTERRARLPDSSQAEALAALMPRGLWSLEDQGQFWFSAAILRRPDGLVAVATTNAQGIVSKVRLNREGGTTTQLAYVRDQSGQWRLAPELVGKPLNPGESGGTGSKVRDGWDRAVGDKRGSGEKEPPRNQPNKMP